MDVKVIKTFLEVAATGHFGIAASHLNVAQTTVSARIRGLEERIGEPLLVRSPSGACLTPAGRKLVCLAPSFVHLGERIMREISEQRDDRTALRIGLEYSLAVERIMPWISWLRETFSDAIIRIESGTSEGLLGRLSEASLDIALVYAPAHHPGLRTDLLKEEKLGLYTTDTSVRTVTHPDFVYVDWGPDFARKFEGHFPNFQMPKVSFISPTLARKYVMEYGGAAYGRVSVAKPLVTSGCLQLVEEAPVFLHPVYIARPTGVNSTLMDEALHGLTSQMGIANLFSGD